MTPAERVEAIGKRLGLPEARERLRVALAERDAAVAALDAASERVRECDIRASRLQRSAREEAEAPMPAPDWLRALGLETCRVKRTLERGRWQVAVSSARLALYLWADTGVPFGKRKPVATPEQVAALVADYAAWERRDVDVEAGQ